jgi:hypothetical protein
MEMPHFLRCILAIAVALPIVLLSGDAGAIPVFARKYQTSCTTCHFAAFPQLNAFGVAFRDRGYRIPPDDEVYVKDIPITMGVDPWRKLFPDAVWPTDIPGLPPLSIITMSNFVYRPHRQGHQGKNWFDGVGEVELLTGGTFGESLSWFGALALFERSDFRGSNTELERWFFTYSPQILGLPLGRVNIRIGRFSPRGQALFNNHTDLLGHMAADFANVWAVLPASNFTSMFPSQKGIEIFGGVNGPGGKGGLRYAAGIVNGEPTDWAFENFGEDGMGYPRGLMTASGMFNTGDIVEAVHDMWEGKSDINNAKDYYARLEYKIGGMGVLGGTTPEAALKLTQNWQDPSVTIGSFFYRGKTGAFRDFTEDAPSSFERGANSFWRFGGDVTLNWWNFQLTGAATFYRDRVSGAVRFPTRNMMMSKTGNDFDVDIYTAKLNWVALPWIVNSFRFENVNPDYDVGDWPSINRYTVQSDILLRANVKLVPAAIFTSSFDAPRMAAMALDNMYMLMLQFNF